jgi:hypothetical protein
MRRTVAIVMLGLVAACEDTPAPCGAVPQVLPAVGTGSALGGEVLLPEAEGQALTVSADRTFAEYRFTRAGVAYTARYALSRDPAPVALRFVSVRRPGASVDCASLKERGPLIDAIVVRRGGAMVSNGQDAYLSSARCAGQGLTNKAPAALNGLPDGTGALLADAEYGWKLSGKATLASGDEIAVTVLDNWAEPLEVLIGSNPTGHTTSLGTIRGSGAVRVP